jgi:hypothetical protein
MLYLATVLRSAPIGDGVDKILVPLGVGAIGDGQGLAMRLCRKHRRAHVRDPNLDRPQALLAKPLAMRPDLIPGWLGTGCGWYFHVRYGYM